MLKTFSGTKWLQNHPNRVSPKPSGANFRCESVPDVRFRLRRHFLKIFFGVVRMLAALIFFASKWEPPKIRKGVFGGATRPPGHANPGLNENLRPRPARAICNTFVSLHHGHDGAWKNVWREIVME